MTEQQAHLSHPKYHPDIDGLRAIAVLAVVAFHAFPGWVRGGFIGVDVFFVISGYLISTIIFENLDKGTFSFSEFYARRIRRIFPALITVLVASFAFGWFALLTDEYKQLGKHMAAGAGFVSNFMLWNEAGYFDNSAETKPLLHLWSLGIEEQFYIVWPLLLWFAWKRKFNLLTITVTIVIVSFVLNIKGVKQDAVATFYSPQTRFWELLCGSLLAWFALSEKGAISNIKNGIDGILASIIHKDKQENDGKMFSNVLSFIGLFLLLYGFWRINKETSFPGKWALVPVLGSVSIIAAGSGAWVNRTILSNKLAVWFGLISFPLYWWHWPLLSFARIVEGEVPSLNLRIAAVVLSIALAWLTCKLIERPLRFGKDGKVKVVILVLLMTITGCIGYYTYDNNGLGFRFPRIVQELSDYKYNYQLGYREGTCFLRPEQTFKDFSDCQIRHPEKKNAILLWGDSHAAHLYPGLKRRYESNSNIIQFTASGCPPILNMNISGRIHCRAINDFVFDAIRKEQPVTVVLSAIWMNYDLSMLDATISSLKNIGVKSIFVIGPVPQWNDGLSKQLFIYFKKSFPHVIPDRMSSGLNQNFIQLDKVLRERMIINEVSYISVNDILCNSNGCMTKTGKEGDSLIAWDYSHFTNAGSEFVVDKFPSFQFTP